MVGETGQSKTQRGFKTEEVRITRGVMMYKEFSLVLVNSYNMKLLDKKKIQLFWEVYTRLYLMGGRTLSFFKLIIRILTGSKRYSGHLSKGVRTCKGLLD